MYAGLPFTTLTESWYAYTEGEALAISWSLGHEIMFILGFEKLIVVTNPKSNTSVSVLGHVIIFLPFQYESLKL